MEPIPEDDVEKMWIRFNEMSVDETPELIQRMTEEQPLVLAYLMAVGDTIFNEDERELLVFLGIVIWETMSQGTTPLPPITEEILDEAEEANVQMLEYLEGESQSGLWETTESIIDNYNQRHVLGYVLEAIMEEPEEGCEIRDENRGIMMIYLKTVIDCFDR